MKAKKCKICNNLFAPDKPLQMVCSFKCASEYARKQSVKASVKATLKNKKAWNEEKKKLKEKLKTPKQRINEVRQVFQSYIRMRDAKLPCISCHTTQSKIWNAGHYLKAELYTGLIFNEDNCHKQCTKCNLFLDGNEANYRIGLIERIGERRVKELEQIKDSMRLYRYSNEQLEELKENYKLLIKQLQNDTKAKTN